MAEVEIVVIAHGITGGMRTLSEAVKRSKCSSTLFWDEVSASEYDDVARCFGKVVPLPGDLMLRGGALRHKVLSHLSRSNIALFCTNDWLGIERCQLLMDLSRSSLAMSLAKCYLKPLTRANIPTSYNIAYWPITDHEDIKRFESKRSTAKWVLKPAFGTASDSVTMALIGGEEVRVAFDDFQSRSRECGDKVIWNDRNWAKQMLLEAQIDGTEFSVDGLAYDDRVWVVGICEKTTTLTFDVPVREEGASFAPPNISSELTARIIELAERVVDLIQLRRSPFHIEIRHEDVTDKLYVIEVNPRLPGGMHCQVHREVTGVDLASEWLRMEGVEVEIEAKTIPSTRYVGYLPLSPPGLGFIQETIIDEELPDRLRGSLQIDRILKCNTQVRDGTRERYFADVMFRAASHEQFLDATKLIRHYVTCRMSQTAEVDQQ